jgi:hypothetical protein
MFASCYITLLSCFFATFRPPKQELGCSDGLPFHSTVESAVLRKRPYLKKEWCIRVLQNPVQSAPQENNRYRFWAAIPELAGRYSRVVTLEDKVTIHNAFPDRGFRP